MDFFISGTFWFIEGILCCLAFVGFKFWMQDRGLRLNWWKWALLILWVLFFGFAIAFVTTSLGEGETVAAYKGGLFFGVISIIGFIGLWRLIVLSGKEKKELEN